MFAYNPQPMFVFDLGTLAILEVNNAALEQYGYIRDEFLSMTMRNISPVEEMMADAKDTGTQPQYHTSGNWWHLKKSGEIMYVEITSHLLEYNGTKACHMQIYDVTKRRKAWDDYKFIETVLSRADFKVIRAENGVEAVNICYNNADVGPCFNGPENACNGRYRSNTANQKLSTRFTGYSSYCFCFIRR